MEELINGSRAYFFQNMYLQGIQGGVQSAHTLSEMFCKYGHLDKVNRSFNLPLTRLRKWAEEDKTIIILNGGMAKNLEAVVELFNDRNNPFPWSFFRESQEALNGAITNVGIILPGYIYNYDKIMKCIEQKEDIPFIVTHAVKNISAYELRIVEALRGKRLAS